MVSAMEARALGRIPQMGGHKIGEPLTRWAAECRTHIVEIGCWLGAGTAHLALGAMESGAQVHTYDRFTANSSEVEKAGQQGVKLTAGQNTLPVVDTFLRPFAKCIVFHRGPIQACRWDGSPIGLYVDDAAKQKRTWMHVTRTFFPYLEDGAVVVLMDYFFLIERGRFLQRRFIETHPNFQPIGERLGDTSVAAFRYHKV